MPCLKSSFFQGSPSYNCATPCLYHECCKYFVDEGGKEKRTAILSETACRCDLRPYILVTACRLRTRDLAITFTDSYAQIWNSESPCAEWLTVAADPWLQNSGVTAEVQAFDFLGLGVIVTVSVTTQAVLLALSEPYHCQS